MRDVHDVQQQVCLAHLVQCRLERVHQVGGQLADKSYRIRKQERKVVDNHFAHGRIQRGKQFVFGKHFALGKQVHQGGFAHVGISHQCGTNHAAAVLALCRLLFVDLSQAFFQQRHTVQDDTAVHFQLRFTRAAKSHGTFTSTGTGATTLAFQVGPQTLQTRKHILVLRQFHLRFRVGSLCTHGKNIENERSTVQYLNLQLRFNVTYLFRRKFIVKNHHADFTFGFFFITDILSDFFQLALADVGHGMRLIQLLGKPLHYFRPGCLSQECKLVQIFIGLTLILGLRDKTYQYRCFCPHFGDYKFFHSFYTLLYIRIVGSGSKYK